MICKIFSINVIFLLFNIINDYKALPYIIFELENLSNEQYKFKNSIILSPENIIKRIYYKNLITKLEIGSPLKEMKLLIELNNDKFYISSIHSSKISDEKSTISQIYNFPRENLYDELLSSSYYEEKCKDSVHAVYHYSEICSSKEEINFNINNKFIKKNFPIKLVRDNDGNIPGLLGLLYNDSNTYYGQEKSIVSLLKSEKLIDNYNFFFFFEMISPLENIIKGKLIIGGMPHEIYSNKYSINDYCSTTSYYVPYIFKSWRLNFDKIYIENKNCFFEKTIISLSYEIYNIIGTKEFHYKIKEKFLNKLLEDKKCFYSNFSQSIYTDYNMTFYYCDKLSKNILYENLPNIKFISKDLDYTFELTKEEIFYIRDNFIYLNILFCEKEFNFWLMGQMFTTKYNFIFNADSKQIGIYKNFINSSYENEIINRNGNKFLNTFFIVFLAIVFTCLGLLLGRKIFGLKRKIIVNELIEEQNYEYKSYGNNFQLCSNKSNNKKDGNNNKKFILEMEKKISE